MLSYVHSEKKKSCSNKRYNVTSMKFRKDTREQVYMFFLLILFIQLSNWN